MFIEEEDTNSEAPEPSKKNTFKGNCRVEKWTKDSKIVVNYFMAVGKYKSEFKGFSKD